MTNLYTIFKIKQFDVGIRIYIKGEKAKTCLLKKMRKKTPKYSKT